MNTIDKTDDQAEISRREIMRRSLQCGAGLLAADCLVPGVISAGIEPEKTAPAAVGKMRKPHR